MNWYLKVLQNYTNFNGRARRKEYWMFVLFNIIFAIAAIILDNTIGLANANTGYGPIYMIYILAIFLPGLAVTVLRLHDIGKNGYWFFITLIPFIGGIWIIILTATEGNFGDNEYGPDPKRTEDLNVA